jgi:hypothetical protein
MTDEDIIALAEFMRFFRTRTVIHVADEDLAEWTTLLNRAMAVFGYKPGTYASAVCECCGESVCQITSERRPVS